MMKVYIHVLVHFFFLIKGYKAKGLASNMRLFKDHFCACLKKVTQLCYVDARILIGSSRWSPSRVSLGLLHVSLGGSVGFSFPL